MSKYKTYVRVRFSGSLTIPMFVPEDYDYEDVEEEISGDIGSYLYDIEDSIDDIEVTDMEMTNEKESPEDDF